MECHDTQAHRNHAGDPADGRVVACISPGCRAVERGRAEVTFTDFNRGTLVWPGVVNDYADSEIVVMSGGTTLREGDGYATSGIIATWIVMEEPLEILRVTVGPPYGR